MAYLEYITDAKVEQAGVMVFNPIEFALERKFEGRGDIIGESRAEIQSETVEACGHIIIFMASFIIRPNLAVGAP